MKKLVFIVAGILVLSVVCVYFFIPRTITVVRVEKVSCNAAPVFGFISSEQKWADWWPDRDGAAPGSYSYKGYRYRLTRLSYFNADVSVTGPSTDITGRISVIPVSKDSSLLQWVCSFPTAKSIFERLRFYWRAGSVGSNMEDILAGASAFLGVQKNVYGVSIREGSTNDTHLAALRTLLSSYPSTGDVYGVIARIQGYIRESGARQTSHPIMNVDRIDSGWRMTVAVPTDIPLNGKGGVYYMRLVPGKYLIADVKGGEATVLRAMDGMTNYINDQHRTVMAMPFRTLITDRNMVADTAKWETRIYWPIF